MRLIDRYEAGISPAETMVRLKQGLTADVFVSGVNAVTEEGELVFVNATCNRVAPILFGPDKVILIAGCNKIVPNLAHAQKRICNATVVIHKQARPERLTVILVGAELGY